MNKHKDIRAAVTYLNNHYGRGDVVSVRLYLDGRIELLRRPYGMRAETRRGRLLNGRTVRILGHQATVSP